MLRLDVRQDVELNQDEGSEISLPLTDRRGLVTLIGKSLDEPRGPMDMGKTQTVKTGSGSNGAPYHVPSSLP